MFLAAPGGVVIAQVNWSGSSDRFDHADVFDPTRQQMLSFGGTAEGLNVLDETRVYDLANGWTNLRLSGGPGALTQPAIAATGILSVLFGGVNGTGSGSSSTWVFDGNAWNLRQAAPSVPSPRVGHRMVFDSVRGKVVLYGGWNAGSPLPPETWEWDDVNGWAVRNLVPAPASVRDHGMCYDVLRGVVMLYGGRDPNGARYDTWTFDGSVWLQVGDNGPPGRRYLHAMACDDQGRAILFGGVRVNNGDALADTWRWTGTQWTSTSTPTSPDVYGRFGHTMTWDPVRRLFVAHGGRGGGERPGNGSRPALGSLLANSLEWDLAGPMPNAWRSPGPADAPAARIDAGVAANPTNGHVLAFGGSRVAPFFFNAGQVDVTDDFWIYRLGGWVRNGLGPMPARARHAMCWDLRNQEYFIFGGDDASGMALGDTWHGNGNWTQGPSGSQNPSARRWTAVASTPQGVLLYGGLAGNSATDDSYLWSGTAWTRLSTSTLGSRRGWHAMAYDSKRGRVVLYGGRNSGFDPLLPSASYGDTWEWTGSSWVQQMPLHQPPPLALHAMTYDVARERVVMFGGVDSAGVLRPDVWEWDGIDWTQRVPASPITGRISHGLAYDHDTRKVVALFGDAFGLVIVEPWEYGPEFPASVTSYGNGCPGSQGVPTLATPAGTLPWIGTTLPVQLGNLPPPCLPFLVIGLTSVQVSLQPIGLVGCTQFASADAAPFLGAPVGGIATWNQVIPAVPAFAGYSLFFQGGALVAGGPNQLGAALSGALDVRLGAR